MFTRAMRISALLLLCVLAGGIDAYSVRLARQSDASGPTQQQPPAFNNFNPHSVAAGFSSAGRPGFPPELSQAQQLQVQPQQPLQQHQQQIPFPGPPQPQVQFSAGVSPQQQQPAPFSQQQPIQLQQQQGQQFIQPQPQQNVGVPVPMLPPLAGAAVPVQPIAQQSQQQPAGIDVIATTQPSPSSPITTPSTTTAKVTPPPPVDKNVDLDGDGALSLAEVQYAAFVHHGLSSSVVENLFNQVDQNKDGYLNANEFNEIRPLVLTKAENAAQRYLQNVDTDHNGLLSLPEAQVYILKEYGISNRDVERIWRLVVPSSGDEMDAVLFSKLRRRVRGMSIRLARQIMKQADKNEDGHIDLKETQAVAFEQEGIGAGDAVEMLASVDDNNDGELNAPEFADFERIVRARAVDTSKKALKVVDTDGSGTITMDEAKQIAFDHYGFDEATLEPFFAQSDENEDGQLDAVEFAGFRSVIRSRAVKNALAVLPDIDEDGNGLISPVEAERKSRQDDDMDTKEADALFNVADQDRSGQLDKVELADFLRLVRLSAIKFVSDHFRDYDSNRDKLVTIDELEGLVRDRYKVDSFVTRRLFDKADVDRSGDLSAGEIVDFRHEIRRYVADRNVHAELEAQNRREMAEIEAKLRTEADEKNATEKNAHALNAGQEEEQGEDDTPVLNAETEKKMTAKEELSTDEPKTAVSAGSETEMEAKKPAAENPSETTDDGNEDADEEETAATAAATTTTTTTTTTTAAPEPTSTKAQKKRRRPKTKPTSAAPQSEDEMTTAAATATAAVGDNDSSDSTARAGGSPAPAGEESAVDAGAAARAKNVPKRRRRIKKPTTETAALTELSTTTPTTTTTTTTTTMTTTTTTTTTEAPVAETAAPAQPAVTEEYEECKENDSDCEVVAE